jgi:PAS domain S-box-containing protein
MLGKRRYKWSNALATVGAAAFVLSLVAWKGRNPRALESLFTGGVLFPVIMLAIRWNERPKSLLAETSISSQQSSNETMATNHADVAAGEAIDLNLDFKPFLKATLDTLLSSTRQLVPYDVAEITLWDEEHQCCIPQEWEGDPFHIGKMGGAYSLGEGYTGWIIHHQRPLLVRDVQARRDVRPRLDTSEYPFQSYLGIPLMSTVRGPSRFVGTLELASYEKNAWTEHDMEILQTIADQAAMAIENARLYTQADEELRRREEALRRRNSELAMLYEAATANSSSLSLDAVLQTVADQMTRLLNSKGCALSLWYNERNLVETLVSYNTAWLELPGTAYNLDDYPATRRVLETRQPIVIQRDDPMADRAELALMKDQGIQTLLMLPLVARDRVVGLVELIDDAQIRDYTSEEIRLAESLAAQAAAAIENARLYEQAQQEIAVRKRAEEALRRLQRVSSEINSTLKLENILQLVLEEAVPATAATHGHVILRDQVTEHLQLEAAIGYDDEEIPREEEFVNSSSGHIVSQVLETGGLVRIDDVKPEEYRVCVRDDLRSALAVPIFFENRVAGLISLYSLVPHAFNDEAVEFVRALAAQAAIAIGNSQRYYEQLERGELLRRQADQLTAVLGISRVLRSDRPLVEVLEEIAYAIQESVGFNQVLISVLEGNPPYHRRMAAAGMPIAAFENLKQQLDPWSVVADLMTAEFRISRSFYIPAEQQAHWRGRINVYEETIRETVREPGHWHPQDLLLVPLVGPGGDIQGLLSVDQPIDDRIPDLETVESLEIFAAQAALAIENARLFEEVRHFSQEMEHLVEERTQELAEAMWKLTEERDRVETLYRITSQLSATLDLDHVLNLALKLIVDAVGAERASILMAKSESGKLIYRAALGEDEKLPLGGIPTRFSSGEGLAGWVVEYRKSAIVPDIHQDPRWVKSRSNNEGKYRSALAVPLVVGDQVLGALLLFHTQLDHFNEGHLRLVETAAIQVANAINNAELYRLIFDQAERLGNTLKAQKVEATKSQAILEGVADGVLVADADGQVILFNAAAERILGLPREKALGRTINEMLGLYGSQAKDWMEKIVGWARRSETYTSEEYLAAQLEIGDSVVSVHLAPVQMEGNEFLGTVSAFRDVTVEVEAERAKTEFVSTVSHELRTPMTSVKGYVKLLLMGAVGRLTDEQQNFLSIVDTNVNRLTTLVNDLLDISRIESGRMAISPQVMRVEEVIGQITRELETRATDQGLTLWRSVPSTLPKVVADPDRVAQVLTNLVANACNYTLPGGEVTVSARAVGDEVRVSVQDTGIGISPEDQEKIFDRFFRADDEVVQNASGTGLGLPIVQSLVEMQGGQVWVESEPGQGSTFTFTLPVADPELQATPIPRPFQVQSAKSLEPAEVVLEAESEKGLPI